MDFGAFGPFIRIEPDGWVTVVSKHIEVGQGSHAGLAAIVAEELDADWDKVKVVQAPANAKVYANGAMGVQGTGGSSAIANSWDQLRTAGAAARAMFVQAAASRLGAPAAALTVKDSVVAPRGERQERQLRRAAARRRQGEAAAVARAEGPESLHADRHRPRAAQGRRRQVHRHGALHAGRPPAEHADRDGRPFAPVRRQAEELRRQRGAASGRRRRRLPDPDRRRRGRAEHLGRAAGARRR